MSQNDFDTAINALLRRVAMLKAARNGAVELRRVKVATYTVREHKVSSHYRYYAPRREQKPVLKSRALVAA
jgi:hypothetical protein